MAPAAAAPPLLAGPPEIHHLLQPQPQPIATYAAIVAPPKTTPPRPPPMGRTENNSATFLSTGNPCLDFFFHVVPNTPPEALVSRLHESWSHDALITLKLICNLRGVRGTGKTDKEGFYTAALWLHRHHPKTLASNVSSMAEFGYFKDFPEILLRLLEGPDVRQIAKKERRSTKRWTAPYQSRGLRGGRFGFRRGRGIGFGGRRGGRFGFGGRGPGRGRFGRGGRNTPHSNPDFSEFVDFFLKSRKMSKKRPISINPPISKDSTENKNEKARGIREQRRLDKAKKALDRFNIDPNYRFLYERISDLFANRLKSDLESLNSGRLNRIGLSAKWCPSIDSSFDRSTLLCEAIARKVFPRESSPEYADIEDAHYAYRVRDRLRKEVLVPLRKALELPEVYMSAKRWSELPYGRVASVAMKTYKEHFQKHDADRFTAYLESVKAGEAKIAAGALLPHEVIKSLNDDDGGVVAELQWRRMVSDLLEKGKLKNCIAVCDVSGSMHGEPMEVAVALGILVSELSEEPWKGKVITFSADPQLQIIQGEDLKSKASFVERMDWGMNTDFQKVFDKILDVAVKAKLKEDQMIKRIFVFSDMEFDQASARPWETDYMAIKRKYEEKGYGSSVPEIVFWNLRDSKATPVPANEKGVALVSGFSKNLLTMFLGSDGEMSPMKVMLDAISGEAYQTLVVLD